MGMNEFLCMLLNVIVLKKEIHFHKQRGTHCNNKCKNFYILLIPIAPSLQSKSCYVS